MSKFRSLAENYRYLQVACLAEEEECLWVVAARFNGIYLIEKKELVENYICSIPSEEELGLGLYGSVIEANKKLYLFPGNAEKIAIYDIEKRTFDFLQTNDMKKRGNPKFVKAIQVGIYIYLFPYQMPGGYILKINTITDDMEKIDVSFITSFVGEMNYMFTDGCVVNEKIWIGIGYQQFFGFFDTNTDRFCIHKLLKTKSIVQHIVEQEGILYLLTDENEVVLFDIESAGEKCLWKDEGKEKFQFSEIVLFGGAIWLLPGLSNYLIKINKDNEISKIYLPDEVNEWQPMDNNRRKYFSYCIMNDELYIFPETVHLTLKLNAKDKDIEQIEILSNREAMLTEKFKEKELSKYHYEDDLPYLIELLSL